MAVLSNADVEAAIKQAEDEADYMALKRVEQEEAVDNQEFTEEFPAKLDDDEYVNEDEMKSDEKITEEQNCLKSTVNNDNDVTCSGNNINEEKALVEGDEDIDMLADVKQMAAAAAAAGQASSSFENQLRPIDRYAMRFLDLWDPIIDKSVVEHQVNVVEEEWELERIEKFKEDLEAEIDEDQEPFLYERWDSDFATKAYRQHVEALAQLQLEEEHECEALDAGNANSSYEAIRNEATIDRKPKRKRKQKKTKFKSLKKGPLASDLVVFDDESPIDPISGDEKVLSPGIDCIESPLHSPRKKKRKKVMMEPEEMISKKSSKKQKKAPDCKATGDSNSALKQLVEARDPKSGEGVNDLDCRPASRSKTIGKISITVMPIKRVMVVKPECLKKKRNVWSRDCFPAPDSWSPHEDAVLCAILHEYGTHWSLVSDILYGMPGGGFYKGWFHHPVRCCERFRELFVKYVHSTTDISSTEKITMFGSGKALFKVTEDHVQRLLNVVCELSDDELHFQKHFMAIISSAWRGKWRLESNQSMPSSHNIYYPSSLSYYSHGKFSGRLSEDTDLTTIRQSSKLVLAALNDVSRKYQQELLGVPSQLVTQPFDQLDITLDFPTDGDFDPVFPSPITLSIPSPGPPPQGEDHHGQTLLAESSRRLAENRLRLASEACIDGDGSGWASSAFSSCNVVRYRSGGKSQSLGKHKAVSDSIRSKKSKILKTTGSNDGSCLVTKFIHPSPRPAMEFINDLPSILEADSDSYPLLPATDASLLEVPDVEYIPQDYDPDFFTGLDGLGSMSDITDFG
ncbi:protein PHOTOPERIOD-INDEPENDENT EARLY FLOWERING 1 isoform X1 [Iris pallida]|uniref:Protein PHOTOPERIOD-INDEPENDENT EARLY FLOWERING 1 isoform X1 n=1 Tax=Iris pallida TaxID=29817 RepID=A0AAX6IK18_IRIPA|nr:protein PHOTOPERIOD-INDEPENDENT EARLY FLOWERING 1 isoform X1 [Iris pallida]